MSNFTLSGERLDGIDLARAVAIVGMAMVHFGPTGGEDLAGELYAITHGRAAILFMVVAGVGVSILARSRRRSLAETRLTLAWRGALLLPAGLALQVFATGQYVILQTYGLLFLLAIGALRLPNRWLLGLAGTFAIVGPATFLVGQTLTPRIFNRGMTHFGDSLGELAHGLFLSGPYPAIVWLAPLLLGIWLGRQDLADRRVQTRLFVGGAAVAAILLVSATILQAIFGTPDFRSTWLHVISIEPHSQMPLWLWSACAIAVALLGLSLMAIRLLGHRIWPALALGRTALTFYVGHLVLLNIWPAPLKSGEPGSALLITILASLLGMGLAVVWLRFVRRGPLEYLLQPPRALRTAIAAQSSTAARL